jgi:hypothetical protein
MGGAVSSITRIFRKPKPPSPPPPPPPPPRPTPQARVAASPGQQAEKKAEPTESSRRAYGGGKKKSKTVHTSSLGLSVEDKSGANTKTLLGH